MDRNSTMTHHDEIHRRKFDQMVSKVMRAAQSMSSPSFAPMSTTHRLKPVALESAKAD
jgi:hypothetical protein